LIIPFLCLFAFAEQLPIYELEEVVVTVSRTPITLANANRSVIIISREEILNSPADNVQGLLEYALSVDLQTRGPLGVQADVSIRGGSFEQTLILIDGVKINDPQTGHHLLNIPVEVSNIERIEILKGHGSRIYGPNAFGGLINIVTRKPKVTQLSVHTAAGENDLLMGSITYSQPINVDVHQITISEKQSDGYIPNSEFKLSSLAYNASIKSFGAIFDVSLSWQDKEFGANTFYTDRFPNEWEHTTVGFLTAGASWKSESISYKNSISLRTHEDDFILNSEDPDWVRNNHSTDVIAIESQIDYTSKLGITSFGGEFGMESITSPSLGEHERNRGGGFIEHQFNDIGKLNIIAGAIAYGYEGWDMGVYPGVDLGFTISPKLRLFGTVGSSFRVPTYTDLYYDTVANKGNPDLQPEEATSFEAGVVMTGGDYRTNIGIFIRNGLEIIDWVRTDPNDP
jgi:iron complex outermembrane receptor protein